MARLGAAQAMHKLGATVIMACRSKAKCLDAAEQVNKEMEKAWLFLWFWISLPSTLSDTLVAPFVKKTQDRHSVF